MFVVKMMMVFLKSTVRPTLSVSRPSVQLVFHLQEPLRLVGRDARQRDAGHLVDDFADDLGIDDAVDFLGLVAPFLGDRVFLFLFLVSLVAQMGGLFEILLGDRGFLLG